MLIFLFNSILVYYRFKPEFENSINCELKWDSLKLIYHSLKDHQDYINFEINTIIQFSQREKIKDQMEFFQTEFNERTKLFYFY